MGPANYEDTFMLGRGNLRRFISLHAGSEDTLTRNAARKISLVTDWSGTGAAEIGACFFQDDVKEVLGLQKDCFEFYRASDISKVCREVILSHRSPPKHLMGDMLDRMPSDLKSELLDLLVEYKRRLRKRKRNNGRTGLVRELGRAFIKEAWKLTKKALPRFHRTAHCYICNKQCPIYPKRTGGLVIAFVGNTCLPWSSMGNRMGWLDDCSLEYLQFMGEITVAKVDMFVNECTRTFDHVAVQEMLKDTMILEAAMTDPAMEGVPAHRPRLYVRGYRRETITCEVPWSRNDRIMAPVEHLGAQGFPVLLREEHPAAQHCPRFFHRRGVSKHFRELAGISMHLIQVSEVLLFTLGGLRVIANRS